MPDNNGYEGLQEPELAEASTKSAPCGHAQSLTDATIIFTVCVQGLLF